MDEAAVETVRPDPTTRARTGAAAALGAVGLGAIALLAGAWVVRIDAANSLLRSAMTEHGVRGEWTLTRLDPAGARLESVRLGQPGSPDFQARAIELDFAWGFAPHLSAVTVEGGVLRGRWTGETFDFGDVGQLVRPGPSAERKHLPRLALEIRGLRLAIATPAGEVLARLEASGRITEDFRADATLISSSGAGAAGKFDGLEGALVVTTQPKTLVARLDARANSVNGPWGKAERIALTGGGAVGVDLSKAGGDLTVRVDRWSSADMAVSGLSIRASGAGESGGRQSEPDRWRAEVRNEADLISVRGAAVNSFVMELAITGDAANGEGGWSLRSARTEAGGFSGALDSKGRLRVRGVSVSGDGAIAVRAARATNPGRLLRPLDAFGATPLGPLLASARPALSQAATAIDVNAPLAFSFADGAGATRGAGPPEIRSASGARLALAPPKDAPPWQVTFPGGFLSAAGDLQLQGGDLPTLRIRRFALDRSPTSLDLAGHFEAPRWRAGKSAVQVDDLDFVWRGGQTGGRLTLAGDVVASGPLAGVELTDARAPLDLELETSGKAWRLVPRSRCIGVRTTAVEFVGMRFVDAPLDLCAAAGGAFAAAAANGDLTGGLSIAGAQLRGRTVGARATAIGLEFAKADIRMAGSSASPVLEATIADPVFTQATGADRVLRAQAERFEVQTAAVHRWRMHGLFVGARVADPALPFVLSDGRGNLSTDNVDGASVVRFADVEAVATNTAKPNPALEPLRIVDGEATILDGNVQGAAKVQVVGNGAPLGRLDLTHDIGRGSGQARFAAKDLTFSPDRLELDDITTAAVGVVELVEGPVDVSAHARWSADEAKVDGTIALKTIAVATKGLGPLSGISGTIAFDDLAALTTPPHQEIRVAEINPGVKVRDGVIRFQLQPNAMIALESAQFPFSNGRLSVSPTIVQIGAEETRYTIEVSDLDVAQFLRDIELKDFAATGRLQGVFPLVVTSTGARIERGVLTAAPGGGVIAYTGEAAQGASGGASKVAFDALRSFRYTDLALELNGDLDGEIVTGIRFKGVNTMPISTATLAPGMRTVGATGLPFRFNVTVRAPFRELADSARRFASPLSQLDATQGVDPAKVP
jgi:hypothetical protein